MLLGGCDDLYPSHCCHLPWLINVVNVDPMPLAFRIVCACAHLDPWTCLELVLVGEFEMTFMETHFHFIPISLCTLYRKQGPNELVTVVNTVRTSLYVFQLHSLSLSLSLILFQLDINVWKIVNFVTKTGLDHDTLLHDFLLNHYQYQSQSVSFTNGSCADNLWWLMPSYRDSV